MEVLKQKEMSSADRSLEEKQTERAAEVRLGLVTPARNEAAFLRGTIESVVAQTVKPVRWVIVSDGSTDGTDEIIKEYTAKYDWIELVQLSERKERHFGGKVKAFYAGYEKLKGLQLDIIGNLDADITFEPDYFAFLLQKFTENPQLGVAGTPFREGTRHYNFRITSLEHVSGACQLFRLKCFEDIGGYRPIKTGGVDLTAVITARMKGWQTRSFLDKFSVHHRTMSSANHGVLKRAFEGGRVDYLLGCDPIWQLFRSIYRTATEKPLFVNGALCLGGYVWAAISRAERSMPEEVVRFRRREERLRLRQLLVKTLSGKL